MEWYLHSGFKVKAWRAKQICTGYLKPIIFVSAFFSPKPGNGNLWWLCFACCLLDNEVFFDLFVPPHQATDEVPVVVQQQTVSALPPGYDSLVYIYLHITNTLSFMFLPWQKLTLLLLGTAWATLGHIDHFLVSLLLHHDMFCLFKLKKNHSQSLFFLLLTLKRSLFDLKTCSPSCTIHFTSHFTFVLFFYVSENHHY